MSKRQVVFIFRFLLCGFLGSSHLLASSTQEGFLIMRPDEASLQRLALDKTFILDHLTRSTVEIYGPEGTEERLEREGLVILSSLTSLSQSEKLRLTENYPTHEQHEKKLLLLAQKYAHLLQMKSFGQSVQKRNLWVLKISDNVTIDEVEPEFKYVANMHGDEIVGRELMVKWVEDVLENYEKQSAIKNLVDATEIYIVYSLNPDGATRMSRGNANFVDLNRNFPEFVNGDENTPLDRAPEVQAMMRLQAQRHFSLSANFHGGAVVVNYPWDATDEAHPFESLIKNFSIEYSRRNLPMYQSTEFAQGIVKGADWYIVQGGMQDWSDRWFGDLQVTIELSEVKWPSYENIDKFYQQNRASLFRYPELIHQGVGFLVKGKNHPFYEGSVEIRQKSGPLILQSAYWGGEYYRVLPVGQYDFKFRSKNQPQLEKSFQVRVENNSPQGNGRWVILE
jgi:hypothetical protein